MDDALVYRYLQPGEETAVCNLVTRVFNEFIAPDYTDEGTREFNAYIEPERLASRYQSNHKVIVATIATHHDEIVGMLELRNGEHISLLFVDKRFQHKGISRRLVQQAIDICRQDNPNQRQMSVNSSPYALPVYKRLGFHVTQPEQVSHGIRYIPMVLDLLSGQA